LDDEGPGRQLQRAMRTLLAVIAVAVYAVALAVTLWAIWLGRWK